MPAFEMTPKGAAGRQRIDSYGGGGFRVGGSHHQGSIIVLPDRTLPWAVVAAAEIDEASLAPLLAAGTAVEVLLIGCGRTFVSPPPGLAMGLKGHGLALEWMDTGGACRTFNVLLMDERRVAAALIAVP
jgi:uncharacterized protein